MRIIFIALKLNFQTGGGSAQELDTKIKALIKRGHTATVITVFSKQNRLAVKMPYSVMEEQASSLSLLNIQMAVYELLKKYERQADLFHVEGQFAYGSGFYRRKKGSKPVLVHFNRELSSFPESTRNTLQSLSLKRFLRFWLERLIGFRLINFNDLLTFTSPYLLDVFVRYGVARAKTLVIPDFFDSTEFQNCDFQASSILRNRFKNNEVCSIFCTGRMVAEKGFDIAIKALAALLKNGGKYHLTISGDGPEKDSLMKLSQKLGISEQVAYPGWLERKTLLDNMRNADVLVIPRWRPELTSMIALESLALGVPTIVTGNTALSWQMRDSALTFIDEDYNGLAAQIKKLRDNPELRVGLVKRGWVRLRALDIKNTSSKFMNAISLVLGKS